MNVSLMSKQACSPLIFGVALGEAELLSCSLLLCKRRWLDLMITKAPFNSKKLSEGLKVKDKKGKKGPHFQMTFGLVYYIPLTCQL